MYNFRILLGYIVVMWQNRNFLTIWLGMEKLPGTVSLLKYMDILIPFWNISFQLFMYRKLLLLISFYSA